MVELSDEERLVLNNLQGGLPVTPEPFRDLEEPLGLSRERILGTLRGLDQRGLLSRFGAVLNTRRMGGDSRLAALSAPSDRFEAVAESVNDHRTVTHNYRRDHELNMWFVLSASEESRIDETIEEIESETGLRVYDLPKLTEYYVGLRFQLGPDGSVHTVSVDETYASGSNGSESEGLSHEEREVILSLQDGLPLRERPYRALASEVGFEESRVLDILEGLLDRRMVKRLGCVPNHYALGIRGNGMAVFDVPLQEIDDVGERLGDRDEVTHCYRRPRHGEVWPYNLFAMVHDRTRDAARGIVEDLREELDLESYEYDLLFSEEMLKKTGLRLTPEKKETV